MVSLQQHRSPNFDSRDGTPVDILLMHYTGMQTAQAAIGRLADERAGVSAHYVVTEDGAIIQMVDEDNRAWHAGKSSWAGATDINARAIGIEIVNPGHEFGYVPFPDRQIDAVIALSEDILSRHVIRSERVLGHSDVAPLRKTDPGELFPWDKLAKAGIGRTIPKVPEPSGEIVDEAKFLAALSDYGYGYLDDDPEAVTAVITAFHRHFCPHLIGTESEASATPQSAAVLRRLLAE